MSPPYHILPDLCNVELVKSLCVSLIEDSESEVVARFGAAADSYGHVIATFESHWHCGSPI